MGYTSSSIRYQRCHDRHIQERDQRRLARELGKLKEDDFNTWITVGQDQDQDASY